jgi:hypothetical protein
MIVTRLERQRIEERLSIIFQLIEFFGEEGENDGSRDLGYGNVPCNNNDTNRAGLF